MNLHILAAEIVHRLPDLLADKANAPDVIENLIRQEVQPFAKEVMAKLQELQEQHDETLEQLHALKRALRHP